MEIGLILAIVFAVLFVGMGFAFLAVKAKQDRAQVDADMYRGLYSENLATLDRTQRLYTDCQDVLRIAREEKDKAVMSLGKSERGHQEIACMWNRQESTIVELASQIHALTELWRHSAARAFDLDELALLRLRYVEQKNVVIQQLWTDITGTRETLLSVGNISEERQQRIQAFERQQRVSDGNIQRLEAERDEAVQLNEFWLQTAFLAEIKVADANAALRTQRRHNDTLNTVQARLMRERDEVFGVVVAERGLREGWEQTAGELEWETKRLQTALEVQQNAVTRLDAQLVRARANDTGRDPKTGRFSKK